MNNIFTYLNLPEQLRQQVENLQPVTVPDGMTPVQTTAALLVIWEYHRDTAKKRRQYANKSEVNTVRAHQARPRPPRTTRRLRPTPANSTG